MLLGLYIWETILIETSTKKNGTRRNCFCCLVLSYYTVTDEFELQLTKIEWHEIEWQCFKIDRPKTKLKRAFAHSRVSGTKLKTYFLKLYEEVKNGRENLYYHEHFVADVFTPSIGCGLYNCCGFGRTFNPGIWTVAKNSIPTPTVSMRIVTGFW